MTTEKGDSHEGRFWKEKSGKKRNEMVAYWRKWSREFGQNRPFENLVLELLLDIRDTLREIDIHAGVLKKARSGPDAR